MRRFDWPGAGPALAAWCAALCLALAACSGSGNAATPSAHPSHSTTAPPATGEPASGPAAIAAVKADWQRFFNGNVPIASRLGLLQNGQQFASFVSSQARTSLGSLVLEASATVSSVTLQPPGKASVTYTILLAGKPLAKNLTGTAVYDGGHWKVGTATFCGLLHLAYGAKSTVLPAVCGG